MNSIWKSWSKLIDKKFFFTFYYNHQLPWNLVEICWKLVFVFSYQKCYNSPICEFQKSRGREHPYIALLQGRVFWTKRRRDGNDRKDDKRKSREARSERGRRKRDWVAIHAIYMTFYVPVVKSCIRNFILPTVAFVFTVKCASSKQNTRANSNDLLIVLNLFDIHTSKFWPYNVPYLRCSERDKSRPRCQFL